MTVKAFFPNSRHIKVQSFKDDISNNIIESFNDTLNPGMNPIVNNLYANPSISFL